MVPLPVLAGAAFALLLLWASVSAWVVFDRVRHDRVDRRRETDVWLLGEGADPATWGRRRLRRAATADASTGANAAARELVRRGDARLRRRAAGRTWRRTQALRVLVRGRSRVAFTLLRDAIAHGSPDLRAAAVAIAAEQHSPVADDLLLEVLISGAHPRSRTATDLAPRARRLAPQLLELATYRDDDVRYWALMLLREAAAEPRVTAAAVAAAQDSSGAVRGAAARVLGASGSKEVEPALRSLLSDDVFYVRAHAARAAGEVGADELAGEVAELLADESWWVRAAAKESLLVLGPRGLNAAAAMLGSDDRFARDGADEVVSVFRRRPQTLLELAA